MPYDPDRHHRRSIRLRGYDYRRAGAYFVTVCAQDRECLFGAIVAGEVQLSLAGHMIRQAWIDLPSQYPGVDIDIFVVMPNHIHGIIILPDGRLTRDADGAGTGAPPVQPHGRWARLEDGAGTGAPPVQPHGRWARLEDGAGTGAPPVHTGERWAADAGAGSSRGRGAHGGAAPPSRDRAASDAAGVRPLSLPDVIQRYKSFTTAKYRHGVLESRWPPFRGRLWHRNYFEHIIRNERALDAIRRYIEANPARWADDEDNPANPNRW